METIDESWITQDFRHRVALFSHAAIILTLVTIWLIYLVDVLQPLFIALGIYFVLKPGADYLSQHGAPVIVSYITMLLVAIMVVVGAGFFAFEQAVEVANDEAKMNDYSNQLDDKWDDLKSLPFIGEAILDSGANESGSLSDDLNAMGITSGSANLGDILGSVVAGVGSIFVTGLTVLFFLIFIIFEASLLPGRIERAWPGGASERVHMIRDRIEDSVNTYVVVKTGVGFGTALCAGVLMFLFGIDLCFTWALLTFLFNYVPYIGSLLATIPPLILGLIVLDPSMLLLLTVLLLGNQQIWGNVIETKWAGRALDISPVLLLVVTAFSFWVWGIVGMILSIPIIVIVKIVLENIEATRPLAILLSERAPTLEEAWRDAIKDGRISAYEEKMLHELQQTLGYSDDQVTIMSAKVAVEYAMRRGRVTSDQVDLILKGIHHMSNHDEWEDSFSDMVKEGKLDVSKRVFLGKLFLALGEEEE